MTGAPAPHADPHNRAADLVAFTQSLVRIPSVFDPARGLDESKAAECVEAQMTAFGWKPTVELVAPGRPNVFAVLEGSRPGPTLLFEGHLDVVTEGDPEKWTYDPFGAEIVDGLLYGRGSADMKAGVAAMMWAAQEVATGPDFAGRIVVAALVDEEGMMSGAKHFVANGHARGVDAAIICEPEGREVCIAQKGAIRVRVRARGVMAHGAMPQHGRNPVAPLVRFLDRCADVQDSLQSEHGEHVLLGWDYVTPTVLHAGTFEQMNVISDRASAAIDIRTTPNTNHDALIARLRELCGDDLELDIIDDRPPTETAGDHAVVSAIASAHRRVFGIEATVGGVPGSTDGTVLWRDAGLPIVTYGPGGKWIAHQVDEFVEVAEITRAAEVYALAARTFLGCLDTSVKGERRD